MTRTTRTHKNYATNGAHMQKFSVGRVWVGGGKGIGGDVNAWPKMWIILADCVAFMKILRIPINWTAMGKKTESAYYPHCEMEEIVFEFRTYLSYLKLFNKLIDYNINSLRLTSIEVFETFNLNSSRTHCHCRVNGSQKCSPLARTWPANMAVVKLGKTFPQHSHNSNRVSNRVST